MYASLDWLPSLVGGGLAGCGFCLVWYRLRRLERHYQRLDEGVPDPPRCKLCRRWVFPAPLAAFEKLDDNDKRCAGCGGYNGPSDDPPPPVPVAIPEPAPSPPKLVVVREDDPPPVPVAIAEPAPSLIRMGTPHPEHCDCDVCSFNRRIAMDQAQAQTLGMLEDLGFLRQGLKTLRLTVIDEIDGMNRRISRHLGAET